MGCKDARWSSELWSAPAAKPVRLRARLQHPVGDQHAAAQAGYEAKVTDYEQSPEHRSRDEPGSQRAEERGCLSSYFSLRRPPWAKKNGGVGLIQRPGHRSAAAEEGEHLSRRDDGLGGVVDELSGIRQARKGTLRADGHGSPQPLQVFG